MLPLNVKSLSKTYVLNNKTSVQAVQNVSFDVQAGEIFGLLGPNGAGKTTIISNITTLESPTQGTVEVFGVDVLKDPMTTKRSLGVVAQEVVTHGFFTLNEIMNFHSGYYGRLKNQPRIDYLLNKLGLFEHRHKLVKQLSGGMKRRLMIAKALVHEPKLLLLDEPTAGVDIELRTQLWEFVRELKSQGVVILLTTHYLKEAEELCDRVGIINKGKLEYIGPTKGIIEKLTRRTIQVRLHSEPGPEQRVRIEKLLDFRSLDGRSITFSVPHDRFVGDLIAQSGLALKEIEDIKTQEGSLEEAFMSVLRGGRS